MKDLLHKLKIKSPEIVLTGKILKRKQKDGLSSHMVVLLVAEPHEKRVRYE
jgi:hypothetical protein